MRPRRRPRAEIALGPMLLVATLAGARVEPVAGAQHTWRQPHVETTVGVDVVVPVYADSVFDALEATATVAVPVRDRITVVAGISLLGARAPDLPRSVIVSNVYASLQLGGEGSFVTLTLTLPTTGRLTNQAYGADAGLLLDLERPERFTPRALAFEVSATPRWRIGRSTEAGVRAGLASLAPSGFGQEFYGRYAGFLNLSAGSVGLLGELSGAAFLGETGEDLGERTVHHLTLAVSADAIPTLPRFYVRVALDEDARDAVDMVVGVGLRF